MGLQQFCYAFVQRLDQADLKMSLTLSHTTGFPYIEIADRKSDFYSKYFTINLFCVIIYKVYYVLLCPRACRAHS